jgi:hypothetical protein
MYDIFKILRCQNSGLDDPQTTAEVVQHQQQHAQQLLFPFSSQELRNPGDAKRFEVIHFNYRCQDDATYAVGIAAAKAS